MNDNQKLPSIMLSKQFITRNPVILILDKYVQNLPWESIPILSNQPGIFILIIF